jgi:hypothetical protein
MYHLIVDLVTGRAAASLSGIIDTEKIDHHIIITHNELVDNKHKFLLEGGKVSGYS